MVDSLKRSGVLFTVFLRALFIVTAFGLFNGSAEASITSVNNGGEIIVPPAAVLNAGVINDHQQGFNEQQSVLLAAPLAVDAGFIAPGTVVNSHMIFLNIQEGQLDHVGVEWTFDGAILGVMSDQDGLLEAASTPILGSLTTLYPAAFNNRGFEPNDSYLINGNVLTVNSHVTQPGDWIRVVTAVPVPEPSTYLLLGGLLCVAMYVGARKKAVA